MSKSEIARRVSGAAVAQKAEGLTQILDAVRQQSQTAEDLLRRLDESRTETPEQLAQAIEPLAASLAVLGDRLNRYVQEATRATETMGERVDESARRTAETLKQIRDQAQDQARALEAQLARANDRLESVTETVRQESKRQTGRTILITLSGSLLVGVLMLGSYLWLDSRRPPGAAEGEAIARACASGNAQACELLQWARGQR